MRCEPLDARSNRGILLDIERRLNQMERRFLMDLYDRIIAGVTAIQAGDTSALQAHVSAIDSHLSSVDSSVLQLEGDDTASKGRLDAIEAGLGKIADAVAPTPTPAATPPATGTGSADVTPTA